MTSCHSILAGPLLGCCLVLGLVSLEDVGNLWHLQPLCASASAASHDFRAGMLLLTSGSSGLGSVNSEQMDRSTLEMVSAGLHWSLRISRQMEPLLLMLGWYSLVVKLICEQHTVSPDDD